MGPEAAMSSRKQKLKSTARAKTENVFKAFKEFKIVDNRCKFADSEVMMMKHMMCFNAVAVCTQLKFLLDERRLFKVPGDMNTVTYAMP